MKCCMKCGSETIRHAGNYEEICEREVIINDITIECINPNHGDKAEIVWFICPPCQTYHVECPNCKNYCRLTGFPGEKKSPIEDLDGKQYYIVAKPQENAYVYEAFEGDFYETFEKGCILIPEIMERYYIDCSQWYPTGADGSKFTKWKCFSCNYKVKCFDD